MTNEELTMYVRSKEKLGISRDEITRSLKEEGGWTEQDIQNVFLQIDSSSVKEVEKVPVPAPTNSSGDKRPFYIWMVVLLVNVGVLVFIILINIGNNEFFGICNLIPIGVFLVLTIVPVLISRSNSKLKNYFGYGIPIFLSMPIPYFIYDYYTCTGKFCESGPFIFGCLCCILAVVFALFYAMGIYVRKWNAKFALFLMGIAAFLLIGVFIFWYNNAAILTKYLFIYSWKL
ncbi:MAG: hypothetical protein KAS07_02505 [Candidatus Pacebacteria bacterium]|nr:hypothetical protein [Candidatus Paceibacterota bacterium]